MLDARAGNSIVEKWRNVKVFPKKANSIYTKFSGVGGNGSIPLDNLIFTLLSSNKTT